jgi:hypothetical protein
MSISPPPRTGARTGARPGPGNDLPQRDQRGGAMKLSAGRYLIVAALCSFPLLLPSRPLYADGQVLFEAVAGEGLSCTGYQGDKLKLEPHEFLEFNHEIGVNAYAYKRYNRLGLGGCLGFIYNLNGASAVCMENPSFKLMFHWLKVPVLLSLAVIRDSSVMHFDMGLYGSFFLTGAKIWNDRDSGVNEVSRLTNTSISHDVGIRAQLFMDMAFFELKGTPVELGGGLGFVVEKSLIDIAKEPSEVMNSFRVGACVTVLILPMAR